MSYSGGEGKTHNTLRKIMGGRKKYWTLLELGQAYERETGRLLLHTTIGARTREMRDVVRVPRRLRTSSGEFRWRDCYQLIKVKARAA